MSVERIVQQLSTGEAGRGDREGLVSQLYWIVEPLCKTSTGSTGTDEDTSLYDWLYNGDYTGNETAESIAAEWDSLNEG
jgi:hypothetical protein